VVWREPLCGDERTCGKPAMKFPLEKRINTELLIDRTAALYVGETRIRVVTDEGNEQVSTS